MGVQNTKVRLLDKEISEFGGDKSTASTELAVVTEYSGKLRDRCVAKPESAAHSSNLR